MTLLSSRSVHVGPCMRDGKKKRRERKERLLIWRKERKTVYKQELSSLRLKLFQRFSKFNFFVNRVRLSNLFLPFILNSLLASFCSFKNVKFKFILMKKSKKDCNGQKVKKASFKFLSFIWRARACATF